jgi:hypothetical protein
MPTVWLAGLLPPSTAVKDSEVGLSPMTAAGGEVTVKVTGMFCGVLDAPAAVTWMFPVYLPAGKPLKFTATVIVPLLVPEVVPFRLSKPDPLVIAADQLSVPAPVLLIPTVWLAGLLPPSTAVKDSEVGLSPMTGCPSSGTANSKLDARVAACNALLNVVNVDISRPRFVTFADRLVELQQEFLFSISGSDSVYKPTTIFSKVEAAALDACRSRSDDKIYYRRAKVMTIIACL